MLVTFSCEAYADITMFGDVASQLLHLMGHSGSVPGAMLAADLPAALKNLQAGLQRLEVEAAPPSHPADEDEPPVPLSNRARPLIELLEAAIRDQVDVMWTQG